MLLKSKPPTCPERLCLPNGSWALVHLGLANKQEACSLAEAPQTGSSPDSGTAPSGGLRGDNHLATAGAEVRSVLSDHRENRGLFGG